MNRLIAKIVRVITIPPVMAAVFLIAAALCRDDIFLNSWQLGAALCCLFLIPVLAYPIAALIPALRAKGREGQRSFAFVMTGAGYPLLALYAFFVEVSEEFTLIALCYLLSFLFLLFCNKVLKLKASGHACAATGPLILAAYFLGGVAIPLGILIYALILWASLTTKRHTLKELLLGTICCVAAFIVAYGVR